MRAEQGLKLFGWSFRVAGIAFLALGIGSLCGLPLKLPLDSFSYYLVAFCGCLMIGLSLFVRDALVRAAPRAQLASAAVTLLLFAAMRVANLLVETPLRELAKPLLIGEVVLFTLVALAFLSLRKRA